MNSLRPLAISVAAILAMSHGATALADAPKSRPSAAAMTVTSATVRYRTREIDGVKMFYREAGPADGPVVLLLHGFPTSSHMFRNLIPTLADRYHVIAPDLPGFGFSDAPDRKRYRYTFENLAKVIDSFTQTIGLERYAIYVFDYGAPVGL